MPDASGVSLTARRVAAYRLGMQRLAPPTDAGDPAAEERLAVDVAAGLPVDASTPMGRYLRARTAFFDRVTVNALDRGVTQIVVLGAGYDGRALRYRSPGVRWWEVDRLATQADKRARLSALGIQPDAVTYVAVDLANGELAASLAGSGFEPDAPALYLAEGVSSQLDAATLRRVLEQLRSLATPGTRLALSLRRRGFEPATRARVDAGVAALGEPAVGSASAEDAEKWLAGCRWRPVDLSQRSKAAGFVVAAPIFAPPALHAPPTIGRIGTFLEQMLHRAGGDRLGAHLGQVYGVAVTATRELDVGVHRVERADGTTWVARLFPPARPLAAARGDAALLDWLVEEGIPAERTAALDPVSEHDGQAVLVTEFAPGHHPAGSPALFDQLGGILGQIHRLPADSAPADRPGGAWHHLALDVTPAEELVAVRRLLDDARHRVRRGNEASYELLCDAVEALAVPSDLPLAVVHPDLVPRNVLQDGDRITVTDWSGAGRGPRVISLGCVLWSTAGHGPSVDAVMRAYRRSVSLQSAEIDHLAHAIALRPLVLACWTFATGRSPVEDSATWWAAQRRLLSKISARAAATTTSSPSSGPNTATTER
jgi:methyltransferase (TIGR00027 family)